MTPKLRISHSLAMKEFSVKFFGEGCMSLFTALDSLVLIEQIFCKIKQISNTNRNTQNLVFRAVLTVSYERSWVITVSSQFCAVLVHTCIFPPVLFAQLERGSKCRIKISLKPFSDSPLATWLCISKPKNL